MADRMAAIALRRIEFCQTAYGRGCVKTLQQNRAAETASRIAHITAEYSAHRDLHRCMGQFFLHQIATIEFSHSLAQSQPHRPTDTRTTWGGTSPGGEQPESK